MKQKIQDMDIKNKIVVLRCDFNVPIQNGVILDDSKIKASLETINYILDQDCKLIILSHLGKVKSEEDKIKNTLEPVAKRLNSLLGTTVLFSKQCRSIGLDIKVQEMKSGEVLLLENTRIEDYPNKLESNNDAQLALYWAGLGEVFINDAFGSSHRVHASTAGIAKHLPSGIGFLVQKELENLDKYVLKADKPFTVIMGGSKIEDKLLIIEKLLPKCTNLLLGGGLANSFLYALGFDIGFNENNYIKPDICEKLKKLMLDNKDKLMLPLDVIVGSSYDSNKAEYRLIDKIDKNDLVYDIGTKTIEKYKLAINEAKTVFMNGTVGVYEDKKFANGTKEILSALAKSQANVVVGGGDSVSATIMFGYTDKFTYLSSGGGATLEYIVDEKLAALDYISDAKNSTTASGIEILDI